MKRGLLEGVHPRVWVRELRSLLRVQGRRPKWVRCLAGRVLGLAPKALEGGPGLVRQQWPFVPQVRGASPPFGECQGQKKHPHPKESGAKGKTQKKRKEGKTLKIPLGVHSFGCFFGSLTTP